MSSLKLIVAVLFLFTTPYCIAQNSPDSTRYKTIAAGPKYHRPVFYQWLWGTNYRKEWTAPISFPVTFLDTLKGGIKELKEGGAHQSRSLHIKNTEDKAYALRSVDKSLDKVIPKIFHKTFIANIVNDEVSTSHPYGALGIPVMAKAAGIPHTNPYYLWVPKQPILDSLNKKYGGMLYLFEQRPAGDWSDADNLGNFKKFIGSDELLDKMYGDKSNQVDQVSFARARLFDMLIGDWDRHWDQWKWGLVEKGEKKIYEPIPTDRDQAFFKGNGILLKLVISASGIKFAQPFDYTIKNVATFNSAKNLLDRFFTNELTLDQWQAQARYLQQSVTDSIIESSIQQMPPEIFTISGNELIAKLKSRRSHLEEYATQYYYFLAKEVEVVGSKKNEYFEITRLNDEETTLKLYNIDKAGNKDDSSFYSRTFKTSETNEIRLYGLSGKDVYIINGKVNKGIKIRMIGGDQKDSIVNNSNLKVHVYDDKNNAFVGSKTKIHRSDSTDHVYNFDYYLPDKKGFKPLAFYDYNDRFYVGLGYGFVHHKWRRLPFASEHNIALHYSLSQKAFSVIYKALFPKIVGKWDLLLNADYDAVRWTNFYGIGNNNDSSTTNIDFNRMRNRDISASIGVQHGFGKSTVELSGFFQSVKIIDDNERFIAKSFAPSNPDIFSTSNYAGAQLNYKLVFLNDSIVPTKGFTFFGNATYTQTVQTSHSFESYSGIIQSYIPLFSKFSLAIRARGATVSGDPMFYQLPHIGGPDELRGYVRERFWGNTAFTNNNELRFITNFKSHLFNGKIGLAIFYDEGRVWVPNENSDIWHTDYGAGILLAPFNKFLANITVASSKDHAMIQMRLIKSF